VGGLKTFERANKFTQQNGGTHTGAGTHTGVQCKQQLKT